MNTKEQKETRICVRCEKRFPIGEMYRLHGSLLCSMHYDESVKAIDNIWAEFAHFCHNEANETK